MGVVHEEGVSHLDDLEVLMSGLHSADSEQEICNCAVKHSADVFDAFAVGIWLYDSDANELQYVSANEPAKRNFPVDIVYEPGNSLSWQAFESGDIERYQTADLDQDNQTYSEDTKIEAELIIPLGEYGVMNVGRIEPDPFTAKDEQLARMVSQLVSDSLSTLESKYELKIKQQRLEELIDAVSHDIRNPLDLAGGFLEFVQEDVNDERLNKVENGLDRIETIIDDMMMLSKQGSVVKNRAKVDMSELAEEAWSNMLTENATLNVTSNITIYGDRARLLHVFENLFSNAIEYGGEEVTITVGPRDRMFTSTRTASQDSRTGFHISDDGPGIPTEDRDNVFQSGWSTEGTGIGLAIVERVVTAHGWKIRVRDSVQGGARFEIIPDSRAISPFDM